MAQEIHFALNSTAKSWLLATWPMHEKHSKELVAPSVLMKPTCNDSDHFFATLEPNCVKCSLEIAVQGYINSTRIVVWKKVCTDEDDLIFKSLDYS